jgi:phosphoglycolate phosphatase
MKTNAPVQAVLFDLDGTLLDTAPDLATALNTVLEHQHYPQVPFERIRRYSSTGTRGLLGLGFGINIHEPRYAELRDDFLQTYHEHLSEKTQLFPGMRQVLALLAQQKILWGVVTNKPEGLARQLMQDFNLLPEASCVIGGDTLPKRKPDPEPLWHACEIIQCPVANTIYVGDAERDIISAKRAQMRSIAALYGYTTEDENPQHWDADYYIESPMQLLDLLPQLF